MLWLRLTLLCLLVVSGGFGATIEKFSLSDVLQQKFSVKHTLANCLISIFSENDNNLQTNPGVQIYVKAQSPWINQEFTNTVEIFCSRSNIFLFELTFGQMTPVNPNVNYWLFFIDSIESLEYLRDLVEGQRKKNVVLSTINEYYLIMLPTNPSNPEAFLKEIFKLCWSQRLLNVNVLVEDADEVITIYTYYPFNERNCRDCSPTIHNRFRSGKFEFDKSLFLSKTSNFWQCPIRVILWEDELFYENIETRIHGADYLYLETLAYMINSSLRFVLSPEGKGDVLENGTSDKAFKMLNDNVGDVMLGLWCMRERQLFFEGIPYTFDNELIVFKIPEAYNSLDILTFPYDGYTWIILLLVLTAKWIANLSLKRISKDFIPHRKNSKRIIMASWLFSMFILRISYEGLIFKFLHNKPRRELPENLDEAIEQDYTFLVPFQGMPLYSQMQSLDNRMIIGNEAEYFDMFNQLGNKYALIASEKYIPAYGIKIQEYFTAKKPLVTPLDCIYLPKHSFLTKELTRRYKQMDEHGFRRKIRASFEQKKNLFKKDRSPQSFTLHHFMGAFQMLSIFIVVSFVIFVMELISKHNGDLKTVIDLFH